MTSFSPESQPRFRMLVSREFTLRNVHESEWRREQEELFKRQLEARLLTDKGSDGYGNGNDNGNDNDKGDGDGDGNANDKGGKNDKDGGNIKSRSVAHSKGRVGNGDSRSHKARGRGGGHAS